MKFNNQQDTLNQLRSLAEGNRHSIIISGPSGCGKTFLARQYSKLLSIPDFQIISPTVQSIRDCVEENLRVGSQIVLCIENLDTGILAASYALLKFLEEPSDNAYIIVTCRNLNRIPDTIQSRSSVIDVPPPNLADITQYAQSKDIGLYSTISTLNVWKCVHTFTDVDMLFQIPKGKLEYIESLSEILDFKGSVTDIVWKLSHYPDNSDCPISIVLSYLVAIAPTKHIRDAAMQCMQDLALNRLGSVAVLSRFVFECKYCE